MKNNDWICLPIKLDFYPKHIREKAEKCASAGEDVKKLTVQIAKNEGIKVGTFVNRWFPRDMMDTLVAVQEDPEDESLSNIWFEDEDFHLVNMRHDKLMAKIHKFLLTEPSYREGLPETEVHYHVASVPSSEERDEMGDDD